MIKINLVPSELLAKARQKQQNIQIGIVSALVVLMLLSITAAHWHKAVRLETELKTAKEELKRLQAIVDLVQELERQVAAVKSRLKVITDLDKIRPLYPVFMSDFTETVPSGVWVKNLATTGASSNSLSLKIGADARSSEDIAGWIRALVATQKFSDPILGPVSISADKMLTFSLSTTYSAKL